MLRRALHETELEAAGAERREALRVAENQLDRIARVLPDAIEAGLSVTEVGRLTGLSRPTLYQLLARYSDKPRDLRLAVMQGLLSPATSFVDALATHLRRSVEEIQPVIDDFLGREWIEWDVDRSEPRRGLLEDDGAALPEHDEIDVPLSVTLAGYEALERWQFEDGRDIEADGEAAE